MKDRAKGLIANLAECYSWKNIQLQFLAVISTVFIVVSGFDWYYYTHTQDAVLQSWLLQAAILGGILPILLPAILFLVGKFGKNIRAMNTGFAVTQAAIIGLFISSFYKVFTGRIPPPFHISSFSKVFAGQIPIPFNSQNLVDISRQFEFGFFRDGIFWGWPSSHTTVAFAVAVTLFILYPKSPFIKYSALLVALYIGIGVSTNIHWFSEFVAGAIIGSVIGVVVGKSFRDILVA